MSLFVHYLSNERADNPQPDAKGRGRENGSTLVDAVRCLYLQYMEFTEANGFYS